MHVEGSNEQPGIPVDSVRDRWIDEVMPGLDPLKVEEFSSHLAALMSGPDGQLSLPERQFHDFKKLIATNKIAQLSVWEMMCARALEENQTRTSARTDPLTGLLNKAGFNESVETAFKIKSSHAQERRSGDAHRPGRLATIFNIDATNFKRVNDTLGHPVGDIVLRGIADFLRDITRADDCPLIARSGGDEFMVAIPDVHETIADVIYRRFQHSQELVLARNVELWDKVFRARGEAGPRAGIRIVTEQLLPQLPNEEAKTTPMLVIGDKLVAPLMDLVVITAGFAHGPIVSPADWTQLREASEHSLQEAKDVHHGLIGRDR